MAKGQPPAPGQMRAELDRIEELSLTLELEYRRVFDFGHSSGGMPGSEGARGGGIDFSDPTGDVATLSVPKASARQNTRKAAEKVADALGKLREAHHLLQQAYPKDRDTYEPTVAGYPTVVTRADIEAARKAQRRRAARGDL